MFIGRHEHTVDSKGRLAVPAKFRGQLEAGMFVTRSLEPSHKCLYLYPAAEYDALATKLDTLSISDKAASDFLTVFFADTSDCEFDKQGRITIPAHLRELAGISADDAEAIVIGHRSYIQIWSKERWQHLYEKVDSNPGDITAALKDSGQ